MKTRRNFIVALMVFVVAQGVLAGCAPAETGALYLAVAGTGLLAPDGGPESASFHAGVHMAVDEFNRQGGLHGRSVVVLPPFDDRNDPETAARVAQEIADSRALAVIGHSSPETLEAAAGVYDDEQVPVMGVQPAPADLIASHPFLFNATYSAEQEAAYLANYLRKVMGEQNAGVILTGDRYGRALAGQFVNAFNGLGGDVDFTEIVDPTGENGLTVEQTIARLISLDPGAQNPGTLFIAADPQTAARLVIGMRRNGLAYPLAGAGTSGSSAFLRLIETQSEVSAQPGYFTDGLLTTRALVFDSANESASRFLHGYQGLHRSNEPGDAVVHGYNAALAVLGAMTRADVQGLDPAADRLKIHSALLAMDRAETGVPGLSGPLYFDAAGLAAGAPRFATYTNGRMISAMTQFEPLDQTLQVRDLEQQLENGRILTVNGEYVYAANVVYAGIDLIDVQDIDLKTSTYKMDFYLWFRYREGLEQLQVQPDDFLFTNLQAVESQTLIRAESLQGVSYKTYRVIGTFKNEFDFHEYPFDRQMLVVEFRNQNATTSLVQYVVDRLGMQYRNDDELRAHFEDNGAFDALYGWNVRSARAQQNLFSTTSTIGNPENFGRQASTDFSLINLNVEIQRDSLDYVIKSLLPLLITLILAYIMFFLPLGHSERLAIGSTALLTTAFFHLSLAGSLPEIGYTVAMEFFFYASYAMSALIVLLETISIRLEKHSEQVRSKKQKQALHERRQQLNLAGRLIYPSILAAVVWAGALVYNGTLHLGERESAERGGPIQVMAAQVIPFVQAPNPAVPVEPDPATGRTAVLRLRTWRPEDARPMQVILDEFGEYARSELGREIEVLYEPVVGVSYDAILETQLDNGSGPDLFFVHPYSVEGPLARHLLPLDGLPIEDHIAENRRIPWLSRPPGEAQGSGTYYALPYVGVVQAVYYNRTIFDQLDLDVPTTWEQFLAASQAIREAGLVPIANGLNAAEDSEMFMSLLPNFIGGEQGRKQFMRRDVPALCFNNYRVIRAFRAVEELKPFLPAGAAVIQSSASKDMFLDQQAAMLFGGSWDLGYFQDNIVFDWSVFPVPAPDGEDTHVIFQPDVGIGINRGSDHPQEARLFLEWLMSRAAINLTAENLPGFYPLSKIRVTGSSDRHDFEFQQLANRYPTDIRWAYTEISNRVPSGIDLFRENLNRLAREEINAAQAAQNLQNGLGEWYPPAQTCR